MRVKVRRDASSQTHVDLGDGPEAEAKLRRLVQEHGAAVTNEDGSAVELPAEVVEEEATAPKGKKKRNGDQ